VTSESRATIAVFEMPGRKLVDTIDLRKANPPPSVQAVGLAMTRAADRLYVALGRGDHVAEIDTRSHRVTRYFKAGHRVWGVALSPDERRLYATGGLSGDLSAIDLASGRTFKTLKLGGRPWGVAVTP
jgi:YVTN family beta-propeller protein